MALTDLQIRGFRPELKPYKKYDGERLFILVNANGSKYWRLDYTRPSDKKKATLALGVYPKVSLAQARQAKEEAKALLAMNIDPLEHRKQAKKEVIQSKAKVFEVAAREWFEQTREQRKWSERHARRTWRDLETHILPILGKQPLDEIDQAAIYHLLTQIELKQLKDTAWRVLSSLRQIYDDAKFKGLCANNPADGLQRKFKKEKGKNFDYLIAEDELSALLKALHGWQGRPQVNALVKLIPYIFTRHTEALEMRWSEVDFERNVIEIPAERMKRDKPHIIPMAKQVRRILEDLIPVTGGYKAGYVFLNTSTGKPYTDGAFHKVLKTTGFKGEIAKTTVHGLRHTASTILHDCGKFQSEWIEIQLAHTDIFSSRRTYNHALYLEQRREMMQYWADYLDELRNK